MQWGLELERVRMLRMALGLVKLRGLAMATARVRALGLVA